MSGKSDSGNPRVTVIVSPRERFGMARPSLESIYAGAAGVPFKLVYVDARSPKRISKWLSQAARDKGFRIVRADRYVNPNEARNLGAAAADTEFLLFIDNDMVCAEGWLGPLIKAADETGADIVTSLICQGSPHHTYVHQATGAFTHDKAAFFAAPHGQRELIDVQGHLGVKLADIRDQLHRTETDVCEFHCILVRRSILDKIGGFDEEMYATRDHIEFCMSVLKAGGRIMFEPDSVATYVFPSPTDPLRREDLDFFLLRWSPQWQLRSLAHFQSKWGLRDGGALDVFRSPISLGWRYRVGFAKPVARKIPIVRRSWRLTQMAQGLLTRYADRRAERLAAEYERLRASRSRSSV